MEDTFGFGESEARRIVAAVRWVERFRSRSGGGGGSSRHHRRQAPALYELIGDVNPQTGTTYTIDDADWGKQIVLSNAGTKAITLPQAGLSNGFPPLWWTVLSNPGAGLATITPTTSTIDGAATAKVRKGDSLVIRSDGTNYFTEPGVSLVRVRKNSGAETGRRPRLNFIASSNVSLTVTDDNTDDEIDVTIAAPGDGSGFAAQTTSSGSGTTTASYSDNIIVSTNVTFLVAAVANTDGADSLDWEITYTDAFGVSSTTSGTLTPGTKDSWRAADDIGSDVAPHQSWMLRVKSTGAGAASFDYRFVAIL